jgi:MFS family permease
MENNVVTLRMRVQSAASQLTPPIRRILMHSLLLGLAMNVADLLFNFYLVSLGYGSDTAGFLSTIYRFAGVLAGLPMGLLIDRFGSQRALQLGVILFASGWLAQLALTEVWALALTQSVIGAAGVLALTAVVPLLTGVTQPERRPSIFGLNAAAGLMVGLLGGTVGGLLPGLAAGLLQIEGHSAAAYRTALTVVVALGISAALPILRTISSTVREQPARVGTANERLSRSMLLKLALPSLTLGVGAGAFLPFQNLFFREQFGLSDALVGSFLAWGALSTGLGAMSGSVLSRRIGLKRAAALWRLIAAPAMLVMLAPLLPVAALGFFARGFCIGASFPLSDAYVMHMTTPRQRGAAVSVLTVAWSLGWALTSSLSGWSQERYGFGPALVIAAASYVLSALTLVQLPDESAGAMQPAT